jgi:hypothetical protein
VLRGVRVNRLWVYTTDGQAPAQRPLNTLIQSKLEQHKPDEEKEHDAPIHRRTIPKKGIAKQAAPSQSS